jgi:hypothetical protein
MAAVGITKMSARLAGVSAVDHYVGNINVLTRGGGAL